MNGIEFRAIRTFNRISQMEVAQEVGLFNRQSIYDLEKMSSIPNKFIVGLGKLIGAELVNEKISQKMLNEIPEKYFLKQKRNIPFSIYGNSKKF